MSATGANSYLAIVKADPANPGVVPTNPKMQKVNFVSEDMGTQIESKASDHITGNRALKNVSMISATIGGGYDFEMQFENTLEDEMMAAMLWASNWVDNGDGTFSISNGNFYQPFFIEKGLPDVGEYMLFYGMCPNIWSLTFADQSDVTGRYEFVGLSSDAVNTPAGDTYTPVTNNPVFSAVTNLPTIKIDGVELVGCQIKEWSMEINNNVTPKTGVGTLGACATNAHRFSVTGNLTMYFEDSQMFNKLIHGTPFSFEWTMTDNDGNSYLFELPRVMVETEENPITGIDDDVMDNVSWIATEGSGGYVILITKTPGP